MDILLAGLIFIVSYFFIMTEKINRAIAALAGGVLLLLTGIYSTHEVFFQYIDWNTIALLFSMMVLISITDKTGLFSYIAIRFAQKVRGNPIALLCGSALLTAIGSAFLDNVTTVLIFVPVILKITNLLKLPAFPYLLLIIFSSNVGGAATLIGDPPNIMIGQAVEHFTFLSFIQHAAPVAGIMLVILILFSVLHFRGVLGKVNPNVSELLAVNALESLTISPLLYKSIVVLLMTLIGFMLHSFLHIEMTTIALSGAILLMLLAGKELDTEQILSKVEWVTLFFFIGLFAIVGGLQQVGLIDEIARMIVVTTEGDYVKTTLMILWASGLLSGFIDNIPFVAAMIPVIQEFEAYGMVYLDPIWWALAIGACLGGNATLIGASANVVVAGMAESANQKIAFIQFMKYGIPLVFVSLLVTTVYIYIRYLIPYIGQG